jgi:hypothetical protein
VALWFLKVSVVRYQSIDKSLHNGIAKQVHKVYQAKDFQENQWQIVAREGDFYIFE